MIMMMGPGAFLGIFPSVFIPTVFPEFSTSPHVLSLFLDLQIGIHIFTIYHVHGSVHSIATDLSNPNFLFTCMNAIIHISTRIQTKSVHFIL